MWKGREIVLCALAVLSGNILGDLVGLHPLVYIALALMFAFAALRRPGMMFLLAGLVFAAAAAVQLSRMPPHLYFSAAGWAAQCKTGFSSWLGSLLPEGDELAVSRALSIGDKGGLTAELRAAYRESGAMHLLALSGLHVGLIYALLVRLLSPIGGHPVARLLRSFITLVLLWVYAVITGMSASISRAVLMISFYEISGLLSGDRDGLSALAGSALILMLVSPESPRDIGFQLSYTAVLSIFLLHPRLKAILQSRSRLLSKTWELLSVSLCCQATCGVLAWLYFGNFPRYFLLTALLAIPLATVVMYGIAAAVASAALSSLLPSLAPLSTATSRALHWLLHLLNTLIQTIAGL